VTPFYADDWLTIYGGDCREVLRELTSDSVDCVVTSPPYWGLRDYGNDGQLGLERTPEEYVANMVAVFREVRRVLKPSGTCWLNLGDSYAGSWGAQSRYPEQAVDDIENLGLSGEALEYARKQVHGMSGQQIKAAPKRTRTGSWVNGRSDLKPKDLVGIPWRVAFALQADGWYLRSDIIWSKPNPMPESVTDRPTKSHEYLFLLTKSARYFFDNEAVRETSTGRDSGNLSTVESYQPNGRSHRRTTWPYESNGQRNIRSVWTIATRPYPGAHFAVFPPELPERCIKAGSAPSGTILDPFAGSGTVGMVANRLSRRVILIDLNPKYLRQQMARNAQTPLGLTEGDAA
jgi:DNA modification methylase